MRLTKLVPVLVLVAGCGLIGKPLEKPSVKLNRVAVGSVSFTGLDGQIDFDIMNPNAVSLPLRAMDWELSVGGARAVTGRADLAATIPAKAAAPVAAAFHADAMDAADVGARLASGSRDYRVKGVLYFSTSLGELSVGFTQDGVIESI